MEFEINTLFNVFSIHIAPPSPPIFSVEYTELFVNVELFNMNSVFFVYIAPPWPVLCFCVVIKYFFCWL